MMQRQLSKKVNASRNDEGVKPAGKEMKEYDKNFNRFSIVLYVVVFKLIVYATMYLMRIFLWDEKSETG